MRSAAGFPISFSMFIVCGRPSVLTTCDVLCPVRNPPFSAAAPRRLKPGRARRRYQISDRLSNTLPSWTNSWWIDPLALHGKTSEADPEMCVLNGDIGVLALLYAKQCVFCQKWFSKCRILTSCDKNTALNVCVTSHTADGENASHLSTLWTHHYNYRPAENVTRDRQWVFSRAV